MASPPRRSGPQEPGSFGLYLHSVFLFPQLHTQSTQTYRGLWRRQLLTGCLCGLCVLRISVRFAKALHLHIFSGACKAHDAFRSWRHFSDCKYGRVRKLRMPMFAKLHGDSLFLPRFRKLAIWRETHRIVTNSVYFMIVSHHASATPKTRSSTAWSLPELIPA